MWTKNHLKIVHEYDIFYEISLNQIFYFIYVMTLLICALVAESSKKF